MRGANTMSRTAYQTQCNEADETTEDNPIIKKTKNPNLLFNCMIVFAFLAFIIFAFLDYFEIIKF
jgi:hypothetical protein